MWNDKWGPLVKKFGSDGHHSGHWGEGGVSEILLYVQLISRYSTHPNSSDSVRCSLAVLMSKGSVVGSREHLGARQTWREP